jgi:hypothetical protein
LFDREVGRLGASENLVDKHGGVQLRLRNIHAVGEKPSGFYELSRAAYRGKPVLNGKSGNLGIINGEQSIESHDQRVGPVLYHRG